MRSKRTVSAFLAACMLLTLFSGVRLAVRAASNNPDPVYNRAAAPEVAILNAVTGTNQEFYKSVQGSSDWNAVEAGYFGSLRYSTKITGGIITSYQWYNFQNTALSKLREADRELQIGYSVTKKSNYHTHYADLIYKYNMTSYCSTGLGFNTGGIVGSGLATYSTYSTSQDTKRYGNTSYATFNPQSGSLDIAFNQSHIQYGDHYCNCGGTAEGAMVCFYDGVAPTLTRLTVRNGSGGSSVNFKPGDTVEIVLTCSEGLRFADDSKSGKGNVYIGLKLNGSTTVLYPHLTKLDGNELTFSLETDANDAHIYDIAAIDLTAAPSGGTTLFGSSAKLTLKQLNSRHAFIATVPGGSNENGITKTTCPVTDMAGNALYLESWQGDAANIPRHFYIDGEKPYAIPTAVEITAATNNGDVKEILNKTDPTDPGYGDFSDTYLGVGDSLSIKLYMNELVTGGSAKITTNVKKGDGTYVWFRAYPWGSVNAIDANLGTQFGLGASNGSVSVLIASDEKVTSDMTIDDAEGKIRVTGIEYSAMEDKAGNAAVNSSTILTPAQQYHLDTTPPTVEVSDVTGANRTSYGFRVPFKVTDDSGADGVLWMPATLTLGGGTLTGKFKYAVTGKTTEPEASDWQDGAENVALNFLQSGDWQYLHVKPIEGERYSVVKLSFTPRDYAGNWATTTEVTVTGVGLDSVGPTVLAGSTSRQYYNEGYGILTATVKVNDPSSVHLVQYQWNDGTELTENATGWLDAVGTLGETSVEMSATAQVPSGGSFTQTLWVKAEDTVGNVSVTSLGAYTYSLASIYYDLQYSTAVMSEPTMSIPSMDGNGVLVIDAQKPGDDTHYIHVYSYQTGVGAGNIFRYGLQWYTADFDDSNGYKFTNLTYAGNNIFRQYSNNHFTGDVKVTIYSGVMNSDIMHEQEYWGEDDISDITMTTNAKVETFNLHVCYANEDYWDVFSGYSFSYPNDAGKLTSAWEYKEDGPWYFQAYSFATLEGQQISFDLGTDIYGFNLSDIDWENSYIELENNTTKEKTRLCGLGYGPAQTITLPASEAYQTGYHHFWIYMKRFSSTWDFYSNNGVYIDATEPGTLKLETLAKYDNNTGTYSALSYDPGKTIYLPTQQCNTYLTVDVLDLDGTPHEMTAFSSIQNVGELSVIAWDVAHPENKVNLDRKYFAGEDGALVVSTEGTATNSKRMLTFDIGTSETDNNKHTLGLEPEVDSVIALQVRYANGRYSDVTYLTVHPLSIGMTGKATVAPDIGANSRFHWCGLATFDADSASVVFTPDEGSSTVGLTLYCQEGTMNWSNNGGYYYRSAYDPITGTEPMEMTLQPDGTYVCPIPTADPGALPEGLTDTARGFYFVYGVDTYGNRVNLGITEYGAICDEQAPTVPEKNLTAEDGMFTATYKIYDASLFSRVCTSNTYPVFTTETPRPMTLKLSLAGDYASAIGAAGQMLELTDVSDGFTWKADGTNAMGIYEVTAALHAGCYYTNEGDCKNLDAEDKAWYLTVTVRGVIHPTADNAEMTLNLTATDAHGNMTEPATVSATVTGVQPQVIDQQYRQIDSSSDDRALYLTFNMPVQPEESWINRSIQGHETEWHDAFPIWKDGEWGITFTDLFGTIYKQSLTLDNVFGEYGFDLDISTLDYVAAADGVTITYTADSEDEQVTCGGNTGSVTVHENGTYSIVRSAGGQTDTLKILLNNLVSGGPDVTLFFYLDEFKEQYIAGSPEQFTGTTAGPVTVSYRTGRETSPVGETTLTFKNGDSDAFTFQYYDAPTDFTYTISGKLSDYGITLAAPTESYRDEDAPTVELVTVWKQRAAGFVQAEAFPGFADEATIAAAIQRTGVAQSYDFVVNASDYSKWKLVVKATEPTSMSYATAASDEIPGVSVVGNNVLVDEAVAAAFYIALVDNAKADSAATADNFTWIRIPYGSYCFDTVAPVIETQTVDSGLYAKTVYLRASDVDNNGNLTGDVIISGEGVVANTGANAAEYPYMIVFEDNTSVLVTATDTAGNSSTATVQVTGIDKAAPVLSVSWSPCYYDEATGVRDTSNPTLGPVNTDVMAHVTSSKPIARVEATYTDYNGNTVIYDFDNPNNNYNFWGSIEYNSQRISVRFEDSNYLSDEYDTVVTLTVFAPNGASTTIPLTLKRGSIDKYPPEMYVIFDPDQPMYGCGYLYREGYSVPYAAVIGFAPYWIEEAFYCTNYGPVGEVYYMNTYPDDGDDYNFMYVTLYDDSEQTFRFVDKAGNQTTAVVPAPENNGYFGPTYVYNLPLKEDLEILDSKAPVFTVALDDEATATNGAIQATVTANEECTITANSEDVTCGALTQGTDGEGNVVWTGTVTIRRNATYRLTATDLAGNQSMQTFTVNNLDKTLPLIGFATSTVSIRQDSDAAALTALLDAGVTTWDNVAIKAGTLHYDVSAVLLDTVGVFPVRYTVEDTAGNVGQATRYVKVIDKNQPIVTVDGMPTEQNGVLTLTVGAHVLSVGGLQAPGEPYNLTLVKGIWSAGQIKRAQESIEVAADGNFTLSATGFYTLYIVTQSRQTYRALLYVEN